jgi:hypothetical protein
MLAKEVKFGIVTPAQVIVLGDDVYWGEAAAG